MMGQVDQAMEEQVKAELDAGGIIRGEVAEYIRSTRVREQWERYDSVVIGQTATAQSDGWYENWADFANAANLAWFTGRGNNVGQAFTNQFNERYDYAQDLYQTTIEFIAPIGLAEFASEPLDALFFPTYFTKEAPNFMAFKMELAESDNILKIPGAHAPAGSGLAGTDLDSAPAPAVYAGSAGVPIVTNSWKWPEPVLIPAKGSMKVEASIANPMKQFLQDYGGCPGVLNVPMCPPDPQGATNTLPNWYIIRITHRGPRYLQIRGARSA